MHVYLEYSFLFRNLHLKLRIMEEKLNELLEKAELQLFKYDDERVDLNHKIAFMREHGFARELDWLRYKKDSMVNIFEDYRDTVRKIRDVLNKWQS